MATLNVTNITPPRVPLTDERTGLISREWYRFFLNLFVLTGSGTSQVSLTDLQIGPPSATVEDLQSIKPDQFGIAPSQESNIDQIAELQKQIEALQVAPLTSWVLSQIAEIQKQLDALNSAPLPAQGTITAVTATAPVISSEGTAPDISLASGYGDTQNPYTAKTANYVLAAPNGSSGVPTFRALVAADIPALPYQPTAAPVTKTADFTVAATDVWVINNKSGSSCTATLPAASSYTGRVLHFQNYQTQTLASASANVVPLAGGAAGTSILLASAGDSATLVSDGSNWLMTQYVPNNILLLE